MSFDPSLALVKEHEPLCLHTTLRLGGPARWWMQPQTLNDFIEAAQAMPEPRALGAGSNTLVSDSGYPGAILSTTRLAKITLLPHQRLKVECGVKLPYLVRLCCQHGMSGIEYLSHIPGTIGGAIVNNAGLSGSHCIGQRVLNVEIWDGQTRRHLGRNELNFGYRTSCFLANPHWLILTATLQLRSSSPAQVRSKIAEHYRTVVSTHDHSGPNAGSVFVSPDPPHMNEMRGIRIGKARWSSRRANWIIAESGARCEDVLHLLHLTSMQLYHPRLEWQTIGIDEDVGL